MTAAILTKLYLVSVAIVLRAIDWNPWNEHDATP